MKAEGEWVPFDQACGALSPCGSHDCTRPKNHPEEEYHATDPVFGNIMLAWGKVVRNHDLYETCEHRDEDGELCCSRPARYYHPDPDGDYPVCGIHTCPECSPPIKENIMKPTLGRIVHFLPSHSDGDIPLAAIISSVIKKDPLPENEKYDGEENAYLVNLHILKPWGMEIERNVPFFNGSSDDKQAPNTWFWPPRV